MKRPYERLLPGRSLMAVLAAVGLLWVNDCWGVIVDFDPPATTPAPAPANPGFADIEGVRGFLRQLTLDEAALTRIDEAVERLGSDSFAERYLASVYLARLPVLPRARLEEAAAGAPLDKRMRLAQVLTVNTPERTDSMIVRAMEAVMEKVLHGLLPEILAALEGRALESAWDACVGACETTAVDGDQGLLSKSLSSETTVVRAGAAAGLIKVAGSGAAKHLEQLADDPDDRIKLIAAEYLRAQENPACLKAYAALLLADKNFAVRWESLEALQQITGQDFGYYASADRAARAEPARKWREWVEKNAATAELDFAVEAPEEIALFNGNDLEGWKEVKSFFRQPVDGPSGWGVEDGKLVCFGGSVGHLRTKTAHENYVFKFEYRTPGGNGDSGVGLFLSGADKVSPVSLEVQLLHGHAGDFYSISGFRAKAADGSPITYRAERIKEPKEEEDGWNQMEISVAGGNVEVSLNGVVVNKASGCPTGKTWLTLRNEGTRVEFRRLFLIPRE